MTATTETPFTRHVELEIGGMTCASCAARIEKRLNAIEGVTATVNFATEKASIDWVGGMAADRLVAAVEETGYSAEVSEPDRVEPEGFHAPVDDSDPAGALRRRLLISIALTLPV